MRGFTNSVNSMLWVKYSSCLTSEEMSLMSHVYRSASIMISIHNYA